MNKYRVILGECHPVVFVEATKVMVSQDGSRVFWMAWGDRPIRDDVDWDGEIVAVYPSTAIVEKIE